MLAALAGNLAISVTKFMANETRSLIAGEAASPFLEQELREVLAACPELGALTGLMTLHLGPRSILVNLCWRFPPALTGAEVVQAFAAVEARVRAADTRVSHVFIAPQA